MKYFMNIEIPYEKELINLKIYKISTFYNLLSMYLLKYIFLQISMNV